MRSASASAARVAGVERLAAHAALLHRRLLGRLVLGRVAGERQEHLVEARLAEREVRDADLGAGEHRDHLGAALGVRAGDRERRRIGLEVDLAELPLEQLGGRGPLLGIEQAHSQGAAAHGGLELRRRALGDHAAAVDHRDSLGELVGLVEVLRAQQDRRPLGDQRPDDVPDVVARSRVEPGRRLVEEHQPRGHDDAGGDVKAPAHAARVVLDQPAGGLREAEGVEQLVGPRTHRRAPEAEQPADQDQVLPPREVLVDGRELAGEADAPRGPRRPRGRCRVRGPGFAGVGLQQRREHPDRGRLARAVGPEHAIDRALGDRQIDAVDRARLAEALREAGGLDRQGMSGLAASWGETELNRKTHRAAIEIVNRGDQSA